MRNKLWPSALFVLLVLANLSCEPRTQKLFTNVEAAYSNIYFSNDIEEDDTHNMLNFMNIYTGAGVGVGDFNNDGLSDLFFTGNLVSNALYLNKGDFVFEDITRSAGLENSNWCTGVSVIDINQDGWSDIYVNVSGSDVLEKRANLLYINNKDNTFTEKAKSYGLADTAQAMQSAFFDYDQDGDLDMFVIVNPVDYNMSNVNSIKAKRIDGSAESTDRLYRNNGNYTFTDVSDEAGILSEGYSLGLGISDIDDDGWPDIYISNDFVTNDIMYINNGDGTFTDRLSERLKHTSFAGMGNDIADINNDGLPDIVVLDMLPQDNKRIKNSIPPASYDKFQMLGDLGYTDQYTRNTLQLNNGNKTFSEIGNLAGFSSTDWSWSVLLADYDNNGTKDAFITNGFRRDVGNFDYIDYQQRNSGFLGSMEARKAKKRKEISRLPSAAVSNYFFSNDGNISFTDTSSEWANLEPNLSNGAVYADLDNDGDLDIVVNTINEKANVLRNTSEKALSNHYLKLDLKGSTANQEGIGAKIRVKSNGKSQYYQHYLTRGYASSVDKKVHFGVEKATTIDSLSIIWPDGRTEIFENVKSDTTYTLDYINAENPLPAEKVEVKYMFTEVAASLGIAFQHKENDYNDFNVQPLLPHMHSKQGPKLSVGDVNGDGIEDFYLGGPKGSSGQLYIQNSGGGFTQKPLDMNIESEDVDALLFDADTDGDLDLYVVSGGSEFQKNSVEYQDRLYLNDGLGNYSYAKRALPEMKDSGSVVTAGDYDNDGDLDLFVGGRLVPGEYPLPAHSYILKNDKGTFTDVTPSVCQFLVKPGMVSAALWTDMDTDGLLDLVVTGEFMPIQVFKNNGATLVNQTAKAGLAKSSGWWNSLAQGDFDNDGDIDFVAGNLGLNSKYNASSNQPLCIYANDYDKNGTLDPIMCFFIQGENYPAHPRNAMIGQIPAMKGRFKNYEDYANVTFEEAFLPEELEGAMVVKSQTFQSVYLENKGDGKFEIHNLAIEAQMGPVQAFHVMDIDTDGNLDILLVGNDYSFDASVGNQDAMTGLVLKGDGLGNFTSEKGNASGFFVDTDARDIKTLSLESGFPLLLVSSNSGTLKAFQIEK